jgi:hypothetical protein
VASIVVINASTRPSSRSSAGTAPSAPRRSVVLQTAIALAPASSMAAQSSSTQAALPVIRCER